MTVKLTIRELEDLALEGDFTTDAGVELRVIERGDWIHDHKFQSREIIFTDGERFYSGEISRSGSEFTDWTYDSELCGEDAQAEITEVAKVPITSYVWEAV